MALRQPYAAQNQRKRDGVEDLEVFAEKCHRQEGGENRHEIDEHAGAFGADLLDTSDEEDLREKRGKHRHIEGDEPALLGRPERLSLNGLDQSEWGRGEDGDDRQPGQKHQPRNGRPAFERHRVAGIENTRSEHEHVARCELQGDQIGQLPATGDHHRTGQRRQHTQELKGANSAAIGDGGTDQHDHRNGALQDTDIDAAGVVRSYIKQCIEASEPQGRHKDHRQAVLANDRPGGDQLARVKDAERARDHEPAQKDEQKGRDMIHRELAGDGVPGPEQGGRGKQQIGVVEA